MGIGPIRDGIRHPITFAFEDLRLFWTTQHHKDFVVVTLAKGDITDEERRKLATRITDYFFQCGFKRVRIHQDLGKGDVGVISESVNPAFSKVEQFVAVVIVTGSNLRAPGGTIPWKPGMTMMSAFQRVGGFAFDPKYVVLIRGGERLRLRLRDLTNDPFSDPKLQPGDIVSDE